MRCPDCGNQNLPGSDVCESCGQALADLDCVIQEHEPISYVTHLPLASVAGQPTITMPPTATISEVVDRLASSHSNCVLVASQGRPVGIFSERDLLLKIGEDFDRHKNDPVANFMTPDPETLEANDTIGWALNRMDVGGYRHIPVVGQGVPARVVSVKDLLRHLADDYCPAS